MVSLRKKVNFIASALLSKFRQNPIWAQLFVTRRCDLDCDYCFEVDNESEDPFFSDLTDRIDQAYGRGVRLVSFMGGEPLLRDDLPDLIRYCEELGIVSYLSTNGTRLGQVDLRGLDILEVSIDGYGKISSSRKTIKDNPSLAYLINKQRSCGISVKLHQVITEETFR